MGKAGKQSDCLNSKKKKSVFFLGIVEAPCRSYRNKAPIPQAKQKRLHQILLIGIKEQKTEVEDWLN